MQTKASKVLGLLIFFMIFLLPAGCSKKDSTAEQAAKAQPKTMTNSIGMEFILAPAGTFQMGCDKNFDKCEDQDFPAHDVQLTKPFYLGKFEVTQEQWMSIMIDNPSSNKGQKFPVEMVSYTDVMIFIEKLNQKEGTTTYRLPTEAEWEYAARAGAKMKYGSTDDKSKTLLYAWLNQKYKNCKEAGCSKPVGSRLVNAWGFFDMCGNVYEYNSDLWDTKFYPEISSVDPVGPSSGEGRAIRGGSFASKAKNCRPSLRGWNLNENQGFDSVGFRLAKSVE